MDNRRTTAVSDLEARIGHTFADRKLLEQSLTHASVGDGAKKTADNEVLEFIGDRVLG
ncbi:ribonuclease III, partial [Pseudomonas sp. HMWF010]